MSTDKQLLDLDALAPPKTEIKLGDQTIEVNPPTTGDLLRLGSLGKKMETADELDPDGLDNLVNEITAQVVKMIPELANKPLNTRQLLKLVELLGEMGTPPEAKELKDKGITPANGSTSPKA